METKELQVTDKRIKIPEAIKEQPTTDIVMVAMQKGYDPAFIEKMMDLAERNQANLARQAYFEAVSAFKANPPEVLKDKINNQFNSGYTSLGNLLKTVNPALGNNGLSVSFSLIQKEKDITVTCILNHRNGHSESVSLTAPPDTSGGNSKNPIQQIKSTITYLRAATFEAVTGLAATDSNLDDDGNSAGTEYIDDKQLSTITDYIDNYDVDKPKFLKYMKVESLKTITTKQYSKAIASLDAKKRAKEKDPKNDN